MSLGYYGTSHHALEDLAVMRAIADLTVVCAADANQLRAILRASLDHGPARCTSGSAAAATRRSTPRCRATSAIGRAARLREGGDLTIITTGSEVRACLDAADSARRRTASTLASSTCTRSARSTRDEVLAAADETGAVLTVEEHNVTGGLGSAVAETLADAGAGVTFRRHGVPDEHVVIGPPAALYAHYDSMPRVSSRSPATSCAADRRSTR